MVKYTLIYFNVKGRGEVARILFALGGVKYEDKIIKMEDWPKFKSEMPLGQIPVLDIDGEKICQSVAIGRYLAKKVSAYGSNIMEETKIDVIVDAIEEFLVLVTKARFAPDDKEKKVKDANDRAPIVFKFVDEILSKSSNGFLIGNKVSVADIAVFHYLDTFVTEEDFPEMYAELRKHKRILEHQKKIANLPRIKEYLASRPETPF